MNNAEKELIAGIEIYDYKKESFMPVMSYDKWRVAYLNHCEAFDEAKFCRIEKHMETDEVFVLLEGEATLIIGKEHNRIEMEPHKVYNIPKGVWHHIFTKEGTRVLIVENADTGAANTEILNFK